MTNNTIPGNRCGLHWKATGPYGTHVFRPKPDMVKALRALEKDCLRRSCNDCELRSEENCLFTELLEPYEWSRQDFARLGAALNKFAENLP